MYRYVSQSKARLWLIHTWKNTRGRGTVPDPIQEDKYNLTEEDLNAANEGSGPQHASDPTSSGDPAVPPQTAGSGGLLPSTSGSWRENGGSEGSTERASTTDAVPHGAATTPDVPGSRIGAESSDCAVVGVTRLQPSGSSSRGAQGSSHSENQGESSQTRGSAAGSGTPADGTSQMDAAGSEEGAQAEGGGGSGVTSPEGRAAGGGKKLSKRMPAKKWSEERRGPAAPVQPTSTYTKICLQCRAWRRPEGGLNGQVLASYLRSLLFHLAKQPGCSLRSVCKYYGILFTPVDLRDMLEILEELGCVKLMTMPRQKKPSLFSPRPSINVIEGPDVLGADLDELIIEPTVDCAHRLGQFVDFLQ